MGNDDSGWLMMVMLWQYEANHQNGTRNRSHQKVAGAPLGNLCLGPKNGYPFGAETEGPPWLALPKPCGTNLVSCLNGPVVPRKMAGFPMVVRVKSTTINLDPGYV